MNIYAVNTGSFRLDGGAMFGVVPKVLWNKSNPADENNLIELSARCLLIVKDERKILVDTGLGSKQDDVFMKRFMVRNISIEDALGEYNLLTDDITDVIITHLHFDHCGGATRWNADKTAIELTFKNAAYYLSEKHFEKALKPNKREKASVLDENISPYLNSKQLNLIKADSEILPGINVKLFNGHTEAQLIPFIDYNGRTVVFTGDFIALSAHIPIPYVMAYDINPLLSMEEKENFFKQAIEYQYVLFFEHDPYIECCNLKWGKKGAEIDKVFSIRDV